MCLARPGCYMEGCVVVVQLSHRAELDAFLVIQKDLIKRKENIGTHRYIIYMSTDIQRAKDCFWLGLERIDCEPTSPS